MADKHSQEHSEYNTYSDFLSEAKTIPLFNYEKRKEDWVRRNGYWIRGRGYMS